MSLEFLSPSAAAAFDGGAPIARSPMERDAGGAGARFEIRDGWSVAVDYGPEPDGSEAWRRTAGWSDLSHLGKLEVQAAPDDLQAIVRSCAELPALELGHAGRALEAWWCLLAPTRALVICAPAGVAALRTQLEEAAAAASGSASVVEVTTAFAALAIVGPLARDLFARFTALDVREQALPVAGVRPGSAARQPAILLREAPERFLLLFGSAVGHYLWTVVEDAGRRLGAVPVGVDALDPLPEPLEEAPSRA